MNEVVGHKTFRNPDGSFRHEPLYADEAAELWARAEAAQARRAEQMPDEQAAIRAMFEAWQRLKELGWREAMYCPKDGSYFDVIEPGSTGIHRCNYYGEWPTGSYWIDGDSPSHPVLFRLPLQRNYSGITAGAEKSSQVFDSGAAGPTRTGDLLITNQGAETAETLGNQQDTPTPAPAEGAKVAQGESITCEGVTAGLRPPADRIRHVLNFAATHALAALAELEADAEIGRDWRADSSLAKWFPSTAREMDELRANLAEYEQAPTVAVVEGKYGLNLAYRYPFSDKPPPIGTELIARPTRKDGAP